MNLNLWNQLTLEEMNELERRYDFGITDQVIKDVIRLRGAYPVTAETLRRDIAQLQVDVSWHNEESAKYRAEGNAWMLNHHNTKAREKLDRLDKLQDQLAGMTAPVLQTLAAAE